jgi:23S rRNA pseudouridine1911/1915/1917 synthase
LKNKGAQPGVGNDFPEDAAFRGGIVHRLDKDTSGLIIAAYDYKTQNFLSNQFRDRTVQKTYAAIVHGKLPSTTGKVDTFITRDTKNRKIFATSTTTGKHAITYYRLVRTFGPYSLILLRPKTGRTHQLRVHMRYIGCPILGDPLYGPVNKTRKLTLMLHAKSLSLVLPDGKSHTWTSSLPQRFLRQGCGSDTLSFE